MLSKGIVSEKLMLLAFLIEKVKELSSVKTFIKFSTILNNLAFNRKTFILSTKNVTIIDTAPFTSSGAPLLSSGHWPPCSRPTHVVSSGTL